MCILPKWDPSKKIIKKIPDLTIEQHTANDKAFKENGSVLFNLALPAMTTLSDGFRAFTSILRSEEMAHQNSQTEANIEEETEITIGGASQVNIDGEPEAAGALWYGINDRQNRVFKVPENLASTEAGELAAILEAARTTPKNLKLKLYIKSNPLIKCLIKDALRSEQTGWIQVSNTKITKAIIAELRKRSAETRLQTWGTNLQKQDIDEIKNLTQTGLDNANTYNILTTVKMNFNTSGILMTQGTQCLFYRGIREINNVYKKRRLTRMALAMTHHAVREIGQGTPTEMQIWKSIRDKDIPKGICRFLWKNLRGVYCLGDFWLNILNFEKRGTCKLCGGIESMEHILIECQDSLVRQTVWNLAEKLWCRRENDWPVIRYGTILRCNLAHFTDSKKKRLEGKTRLFSILISESAHLIWKLRCEHVIKFNNEEDKFHPKKEIHNRWVATLNKRLKFDKLLTNTSRYGKKALRENLVLQTWSGVPLDEDDLPDNWI
ncbi:hypothetical protein F4604DRAFT_1683755 [Suillus subluteus]|nr:hypothetical protein F4604DRAFT_1683755 [Suillus subluteus]